MSLALPIRYSPSGKVIAEIGTGMQLRLEETNSTMSGSLAVPAVADVISSGGFGVSGSAIVLTLANPKEDNLYRAELSLDVQNTATNVEGQVVLYLDTSVDGGTTWTNRAKTAHLIDAETSSGESRQMQINLCLISGESLGVDDSVPTANLKIRARASLAQGSAALVLVNSPASSGGGSPVTNLDGTIHMEFTECLG